jgi:hypothetical protein
MGVLIGNEIQRVDCRTIARSVSGIKPHAVFASYASPTIAIPFGRYRKPLYQKTAARICLTATPAANQTLSPSHHSLPQPVDANEHYKRNNHRDEGQEKSEVSDLICKSPFDGVPKNRHRGD